MAHIHEKIDFTASVYIVHENKVLLHRHKKLGIWLAPGGHIELDEDPTQAAIREAKEETGLDVELIGDEHPYDSPYNARDLKRPRFLNRHFFDSTRSHEHVDCGYLGRPVNDVREARQEEAGAILRWFTAAELEKNEEKIVEDVRWHALTALKELAS